MQGDLTSGAGGESENNGGKEILGSGGSESEQGSGAKDGSGGNGAKSISLRAASPTSMDENVKATIRDNMK